MLVPIESISIVPAEPDNNLKFAASYAMEEINLMSGIRPSIADPTLIPKSRYTIIIAWHNEDNYPSQDSYTLSFNETSATISSGSKRGLLFGIGRFLRNSPIKSTCLEIPEGLNLQTTPSSLIRGHQIGYGKLSNSMDSWTTTQFDRYIRDLIMFGCNAIEIEYKPDPSPHHTLPFDEMAAEISRIATRYDLDCTLWIPNLGDESQYIDPISSKHELNRRKSFFSILEKISAITIPGGDPGMLRPKTLFPWVERLTKQLELCGYSQAAWISAQWMQADSAWNKDFLKLANQKPIWLQGIVHGPWTQLSIPELRRQLRDDLPIRRYTDLTHCIFCQYPVPNWDLAHAMTSGREPINPRPRAYKHIHNLYFADTSGSTPHTTGINADINTFVWLDQEWDSTLDVRDTLRDYARVFLDTAIENDFPESILALERNWEGPLIVNDKIDETLEHWKKLEKSVNADVAHHWRFQSPLLRAYYDAYIHRKLIQDKEIEKQIIDSLPLNEKRKEIKLYLTQQKETQTDPKTTELKQNCVMLAEELYKSIGLKSSVKKHGAVHKGRGAFMDAIDEPLNDLKWLAHQIETTTSIESELERSKFMRSILNRNDLGKGGIYDNLGTPDQIGKVVNPVEIKYDPTGLSGSRSGFGIAMTGMPGSQTVEIKEHEGQPIPMAWLTCIEAIYHTPLILSYEGLDDSKTYGLHIVYPSRIGRKAKLIANKEFVIHDWIKTGDKAPMSFIIPIGIIKKGKLELKWMGGGERGIQVAELWITPQ